MWIIVVGIIIVIIVIVCLTKKGNANFFSLLIRDEEKSVGDLTGRWNLIDHKTNQKVPDNYMSLEEDGTFIASTAFVFSTDEDKGGSFSQPFSSALGNENMEAPLTLKGTYIVRKDQNQSMMQKMIKDPENYEWYHVLIDITEPSFSKKLPTIAYGIGINKNNSKEMLLCILNADEVCEWNNIKFLDK